MAITQAICDSFRVEVMRGLHDFTATTGDAFKLALYTSDAVMDQDTTVYSSSDEVADSGSYAAGGGALASATPVLVGDTVVCDFADVSFTAATITARGALLYNSSASDKAVMVLDFGADKTSTSGTFSVIFPAPDSSNAIIRIQGVPDMPASPDTSVQFNDGGAFGGSANFVFNKTQSGLGMGTGGTAGLALDSATSFYLGPPPASLTADFFLPWPNSFIVKDAPIAFGNTALFVGGQQVTGDAGEGMQAVGETEKTGGVAIGINSTTYSEGTNNIDSLQTLITGANHNSTGTAISLYGMFVGANSKGVGAGVVTNNYGIYIRPQSGVATNDYALRIADQGTGANDYAIKVDGGNSDLGPDTTGVGQLRITAPSVPASASASGTAGDVAWDSSFVYVCVATDTWKRAALSAW